MFAAVVALAGAAGWSLSRFVPERSRLSSPFLRAGMLMFLWAGAGAFLERRCHEFFVSSPLLTSLEIAARAVDHFPIPLRGWVVDDPVTLRDRRQLLFRVEEAWWGGRWRPCPGTVRVSLREEGPRLPVRFGDRLEISVRLRHPRNFRNPGAFDYHRYLEGEGIHLLGSVKTTRLVRPLPGKRGRGEIAVHRLRARLLRRLARTFPEEGDEEPRRFLEAILLGQRRGAEGDFERVFRKTGVYHILSISGLHFAILMGGLGRAARLLPGGRRLAPVLLGGAGLLYVALSGGDDPILRSAISALFLAAGRRTGRRISPLDAQAHAGILLLALHPLHLFDPGFQLSFLVTFGILAGARSGWPPLRFLGGIGGALAVSANAWVASTPVLAAEFFQISPIALILNLAAAPFLSGSLLLGACLLALPCRWMGALLHLLLGGFSGICRAALGLPGAFARVPAPSPLVLMAFAALLLARRIAGTRVGRGEAVRMALFLLALLLAMGFPPETPRHGGQLDCVVLDVGQGDAILLRLPGGENVLVDAGGFTGTDFDVGEKVVVPALLALGVHRLDLAVVTHVQQDHGGGIPAVLEAFPPREIWLGRASPSSVLLSRIARVARDREIPVFHPAQGALRCLGNACLEVLHPPMNYRTGAGVSNDDSLVLRLTYARSSVLLTGDLEGEGELFLLASHAPLQSDLLKVAHHGSSSSTSDAFLDAVRPSSAVISVGEGNLWGHPSGQVLDRLAVRKVPVFRTDEDGAIWFSLGKRGWLRKDLPE